MGPQSRFMSLVESWTNILVGIGLQTAANAIFIPLLFVGATMEAKPLFWLVVIMTGLSQVRSYGLRRLFEFVRTRRTPPDFQYIIEEIAAERWRQITGEGFSLADDDHLSDGALARMCAAYAEAAAVQVEKKVSVLEWQLDYTGDNRELALVQSLWPKPRHEFKPSYPRRNLVKALALGVAEIGRLDRLARRKAP